jgi:hypothetical protein
MTFAFEKLLVYRKSVDFADNVCTATEQFQRGYCIRGVVALTSVGGKCFYPKPCVRSFRSCGMMSWPVSLFR